MVKNSTMAETNAMKHQDLDEDPIVYNLRVKPRVTVRQLIGQYDTEEEVSGFTIAFDHTPDPAQSVAARVTKVIQEEKIQFYIFVANATNSDVSIRVYPL